MSREPLGGVAHPDMCTRYSRPLSEDFPSLFDRYAPALRIAWQAAMGYWLDGWQVDLLRRVLEVYPPGHPQAGELRYRQTLCALPRQQGKTEIAACLGLLMMLARPGGYIAGIAATAEQARLVYKRTMQVIGRNRALAQRFEALTETRGIRAKSGATYEIKASKSAALQGLPIDLAIVDEVHIVKPELWSDLLNGTGSRPDTLVAGISTAGDEASELLKRLYDAADRGTDERFGWFIYEAPEARVPDDDATLGEYLRVSNPALACGRLDLRNVLADVRAMPPEDVIHYRLNRFVSASAAFVSPSLWAACARDAGEAFPRGQHLRPTFAIDRTPEWSHAAITASVKDEAGMLHTEVVASVVDPTLDRLEMTCVALAEHQPGNFVVDGYSLKDLGARLKQRGLPVQVLNHADSVAASSLFYAKVARRGLRHAADPLLTVQIPRTARKNVGAAFRVSRSESSAQIDAVMATVLGLYVAETAQPAEDQLFV